MSGRRIERFKNIIIVTLFISSIIQVGILWNNQNHGFPISFLTTLYTKQDYKSSFSAAEALRTQYFMPYKVIVSEGFDGRYWIAEKDSQEYNELWSAGKDYLKGVLNNSTVQGFSQDKFSNELWLEIFKKTAVIIEFKSGMPKDLLASLLSAGSNTGSANNLSSVTKIVISPLDDINLGLNTIYLISNEDIFKYTVTVKNDRFNKENIINVIDKFANQSIAREYISEKVAFKGRLPFKTSSDLLLSAGGNKYEKLKGMACEPPSFIKVGDPDEAAKIILDNEKFSYYNTRNADDTIEFKNYNNSYSFSPKGVFEYKYLQNEKDISAQNISSAYENTVKFMERIKSHIKGADLYLTEVKEDKNKEYYEFTFDYNIGGLQVFVENMAATNSQDTVNHAVRIRANSSRVLNCIWLLRDFTASKEKMYNVNHIALIDSLPKKLGSGYRNNFSIKEINFSFRIQPTTAKQEHDVLWGIDTLDGIHYSIEMESK